MVLISPWGIRHSYLIEALLVGPIMQVVHNVHSFRLVLIDGNVLINWAYERMEKPAE